MPAGGEFVVFPRWATGQAVRPFPDRRPMLVTGPGINVTALRATVRRILPGGQVIIRRQVLASLTAAPALGLSESLYLAGAVAAAALGALAVLFSLASSARSRSAMLTRLAALGMARSQALLVRNHRGRPDESSSPGGGLARRSRSGSWPRSSGRCWG